MLGREASELNLIVAHLGAGASVTAVKEGKSIDTSMGLTPLEGSVTECLSFTDLHIQILLAQHLGIP